MPLFRHPVSDRAKSLGPKAHRWLVAPVLAIALLAPRYAGTQPAELEGKTAPVAESAATKPEVVSSLSSRMREKPRLFVLTDISNEPDDEESLVRLLVYANQFDIEGLVATTSVHLRKGIRTDLIRRFVETYGEVRDNLAAHAPGYPEADHLLARVKAGNTGYGLKFVGDRHTSAGARHLINVVDAHDTRPIWVAVWGGANTLAQALYEVRKNRTRKQIDAFVAKLRVYAISDQDDAGPWLRRTFKNLYYVVSPSVIEGPHFEYHEATWSGIAGDRFYKNGPMIDIDLVENPWLEENIINNHGPLGALYPPLQYIMEGDTPSFLNLIGNGLGAEHDPTRGGWGGRYILRNTHGETRPIYTNARDTVVVPNGKRATTSYTSAQASVWRWRRAFQHDFAARMDWCTTSDRSEANHNPIAVVDGDPSGSVVEMRAFSSTPVFISAAGSTDPDNDRLRYRWFVYPEAGTVKAKDAAAIQLSGANSAQVTFLAPDVESPANLHVILEVEDRGSPSLFAYRRIIVNVFP